jgi:hypothetical protein
VYDLVRREKSPEALDVMFDHLDEMLSARNFLDCESLLAAVDIGRLDATTMVGLLSITMPARANLSTRAKLFDLIQRELTQSAPSRADAMLRDLR